MKTRKYLSLVVAVLILAACGTSRIVPVTGRKQSVYSDNAEILTSSFSEYKNFVNTAKLSTNANNTAMVKRVGQKLATAVETYLRNNGYEAEVQNYNWEFNLVQDNQVNAFCMPGGKIVVYEGLLPVTQTEQYQKQIKQQTSGQVAGAVLTSAGMGTNTASTLSALYGLGSQMATLKYSRDNETEADHIGLIFAAMAGYNPNEAITFWQRMSASSNNSTPAFLSTHPTDAQRIANIKKILPEALKYYKKSGAATSTSGKKATTPKTTKTIRIK